MYRLKENHVEEFEIKKSRFLCYVHRCESEVDARAYIAEIKKMHPNATHHCYAFIIGEQNEIQRSNDDGEPSGTAGVPMLEVLAKQKMQDIVAISVRYFGGIKLGAGGLIRAYAKSVALALQHATFTKRVTLQQYEISFSYELIGKIDYYMRQHDLPITTKDYGEMVRYEFLTTKDINADIAELTNGAYLPSFQKEVQMDLECIHE